MKQAPLAVFAHDLAVWLHGQAQRASEAHQATGLPAAAAAQSRKLLIQVSLNVMQHSVDPFSVMFCCFFAWHNYDLPAKIDCPNRR